MKGSEAGFGTLGMLTRSATRCRLGLLLHARKEVALRTLDSVVEVDTGRPVDAG
jgi:hypothetical protein